MAEYLLNIFPSSAFPQKNEQLRLGAKWVEENYRDPGDYRSWYWYRAGTVINQSLFRVLARFPWAGSELENAYLRLIPTIVNEDWQELSKLKLNEANSILRNSFHYAPYFAKQYLAQIRSLRLRRIVKMEFDRAIREM